MSWDRDFAGLPPIECWMGASWKRCPAAAYILALPVKEQKSWEPVVAAKPASKSVKASPLKVVKDAV